MGLTIHYALTTKLTAVDEVRELVESLRQFARDLPFKEVSDLVEFGGKDADFEHGSKDDPFRWLKIQAQKWVEQGPNHFEVRPLHIIGFSTYPGDGCEDANFGFCRFPASIAADIGFGRKRQLPTKLDGWRWGSFCKTQYASNPEVGGVANFLRCHLSVVKVLDFAEKTGLIEVEVHDESGYWEKRNSEELAREVGRWNEHIAALCGIVKDAAESVGIPAESAIADFPNFEHLEAKGLERLRELRKRHDKPKS